MNSELFSPLLDLRLNFPKVKTEQSPRKGLSL